MYAEKRFYAENGLMKYMSLLIRGINGLPASRRNGVGSGSGKET